MRILSQDRRIVIFTDVTDSIEYKDQDDEFVMYAYYEKSFAVIGRYSTSKQAKDVITEIFESKSEKYILPEDAGYDCEF